MTQRDAPIGGPLISDEQKLLGSSAVRIAEGSLEVHADYQSATEILLLPSFLLAHCPQVARAKRY